MQAAKLDHDLGLDDRPDDDEFDDFILHVDGWLCEIKDVQIRDGLHVLGAAPDRRGRGSTWCWRCCGPARCGAAQVGAVPGPARGARAWPRTARPRADASTRSRRGPARWSQAMEDAGWDAAPPASPSALAATTPDGRSGCCAFAATEVVPRLAAHHRRARRTSCTPSTAASSRPGPSRLAAARPGQRAADRPQLLLRRPARRCRRGWPGRPGRRWPTRCWRATAPTPASYPRSVGLSVWGTARCAPPATTSPRCSRCSASGRSGTRRRRRVTGLEVDRARRAGPPAHRRHRPHLRLLPRRLPARAWRCSTTRCSWSPASTSPPSRTTCAPTRRPTWPSTATSAGPPPGSSAPSPGTYGAGLLQLIDSGNWRDDADLAEVYTDLGRLRLRPRPRRASPAARRHGDRLPADRGGGQEHRHPRARHRRLRRLLPVPRRHDRHRPRADRHGARRLHRRLAPGPTPSAPAPCPRRPPASSAPGWSTRAGSRRCAGTATRARSSWPPPSTTSSATTPPPAWSPTGCTRSSPTSYVLDRRTRSSCAESNPWALHGIAERLLEAADRGLWEAPGADDPRRPAAGLPRDGGRPGGRVTAHRSTSSASAPGNPEHLTLQAVAAMNRVDVFFTIDKGEATADLAALRADAAGPPRPRRTGWSPRRRCRATATPPTTRPYVDAATRGSSAAACSTRR